MKVTELSQLFEKTSRYNYIINLLANDDNKLCDPITKIWVDNKKGSKGYIIAIMKDLNNKGYFKKEIKTVTNEMYQMMALNTFKKEVKIETVKKAKPEKFNLGFIPYASTLP
jgi:hypothetical protein